MAVDICADFWCKYLGDIKDTTILQHASLMNPGKYKEVFQSFDLPQIKFNFEFPSFLTAISILIYQYHYNLNQQIIKIFDEANFTWLPIRCNVNDKLKLSEYFSLLSNEISNVINNSSKNLFDYNSLILTKEILSAFNECSQVYCIDKHSYQGSLPSKRALLFIFSKAQDKASINIGYSENLFPEAFIKQLGSSLLRIIDLFKANPIIEDIPLLEKNEEKDLLSLGNVGKSNHNIPDLIELITFGLTNNSEKIALEFENRRITYKQLDLESNKVANFLLEQEVREDCIIGLFMDRSIELVIYVLGILKAGAAYLFIDKEYPEARISYMIKECQCNIIFTDELAGVVSISGSKIFLSNDNKIINQNSICNYSPKNENRMAYVVYTSGSTGEPKGIMTTASNLSGYILAILRLINLGSQDIGVQHFSPAFDPFVLEVFPLLFRGGKIRIIRKEELLNINILNRILDENNITFFTAPSLILNQLNKLPSPAPVKIYISELDVLNSNMINNLAKKGLVYNSYGPTETTVCAIYFLYSKEIEGKIPLGTPLENTEVVILNKNNKLMPKGCGGDICISGTGVSRGYINKPEVTNQRFIEHPLFPKKLLYKTGDLGCWDYNGNLEFFARMDNQIKIRGYRIELEEVEHCIRKNPLVENAVVRPIKNKDGDERLAAYLILKKGGSLSVIREYLQKELPIYMVPNSYMLMDVFPLLDNGKLNRKALPQTGFLSSAEEYIEPKEELAIELAKYWESLLKLSKVGMEDNFFYLGGHSLLVGILINWIYDRFKIKVSFDWIFNNSRLRDMVDSIKEILKNKIIDKNLELESLLDEFLEEEKYGYPSKNK